MPKRHRATPRRPHAKRTPSDPARPNEESDYRARHDEPDESGAARDAESVEGHGGRGDGPIER